MNKHLIFSYQCLINELLIREEIIEYQEKGLDHTEALIAVWWGDQYVNDVVAASAKYGVSYDN